MRAPVGRGQATVTAKAALACVRVCATRGVPPEALLKPLGAQLVELQEPEAHVPFAWVQHVWTEAVRLTGDPALGLRAAELVVAHPVHLLDFLTAYCQRVRDYFELVERYQRLFMSQAALRLSVRGGVATFAHLAELGRGARPPPVDDFVVAQWVLRLRARLGETFRLRAVRFEHPAPAAPGEYERFFRAPVTFEAEHDAIEMDAAWLDAELGGADPHLVDLLRRHADEALARRPAEASASNRLRGHLVQLPLAQPLSCAKVARSLGLSPRTLQRQLRAEDTSFRQVLDEVRRDLAFSYLSDRRHSISEVGFLVGFAEVSAFSRAFRRWTQQSPVTWRSQQVARRGKPLAQMGKTPAALGR